jgi:hypothetical protein
MRLTLIVSAIVVAVLVAAVVAGTSSWSSGTAGKVQALVAATTAGGGRFSVESVQALPPPVARYLRGAIPDGHALVRSVVLTQDAEFFINNGWRPLTATQHFSVSPPAFVWDARIQMAPLMPASVRDAYVNGHGSMQASMYGLYSMVDQRDNSELNSGALQRLLAELVWLPTAFVSTPQLSWAALDDRSAAATLTHAGTSVTMVFEFDEQDRPVRMGGKRYKEAGGRYTLEPWVVECREVGERDGMVIPLFCEVAWMGAQGPEPYWRGRISSIRYEY